MLLPARTLVFFLCCARLCAQLKSISTRQASSALFQNDQTFLSCIFVGYGRTRLQLCFSSTQLPQWKVALLLLLSGDVASNPGPADNVSGEFCFLCKKKFIPQAHPIPCESCGQRAHSGCTSLTAYEKQQWRNGDFVPWFCGAPNNCLPPISFPFLSDANITVSWSELPNVSSTQSPSPPPSLSPSPASVDPIPTSSRQLPVIMSANVNGFRSKLASIAATVSTYGILAFAMQESKLCASVSSFELAIANYILFRRDRSANGGGVCILAHESLHPSKVSGHRSLELVACKLHFRNRVLMLASCYRPPGQSANQRDAFVSDLSDWIAALGTQVQDLVLVGDFNVDPADASSELLFRSLSNLRLQRLMTAPTHGDRTLDFCFVGQSVAVNACGLGPTFERQLLGHASVYLQLTRLSAEISPSRNFDSFRFEEGDWDRAAFELAFSADGSNRDLAAEVTAHDSVDSAANHLSSTLLSVLRKCVPHRTVRVKRFVPWMTHSLAKLIHRKSAAFSHFRSYSNPSTLAKYRDMHRKVRVAVREAKQGFVLKCFESVNNLSEFWKAVRKVSGEAAVLPSLPRDDGSFAVFDTEKAELFSQAFQGNFNDRDCLPPAFDSAASVLDPNCACSAGFVQRKLGSIQTSAVGLDLLPVRFLHQISHIISGPVATLINRCFQDQEWPAIWKNARVVPIPKVSSPSNTNDFRPVSILPILSKVAEAWFLHLLRPFLWTSPWQFGFKSNSGTEDAIAAVTHLIASGWQKCTGTAKVAVVSLDIRHAFDQIPHNALLVALQQRHCPIYLLRLLRSYLSNRTQVVSISNSVSASASCVSGIGQGSLLGPALFNAYIDTIFSSQLSPGTSLILYADDCLVVRPIQSAADELALNSDLAKLQRTYDSLFLTVNPAKSKVLLCSISPRPATFKHPPVIAGVPLQAVSSLKYLGVYFDRKLDFQENTTCSSAKTRRCLGILKRAFGSSLSCSSFAYLYRAKCLPVLSYAIAVVSPRRRQDWLLLERTNRLGLRYASNDYSSSYQELLQRLSFHSLSQLCFVRRCSLLHKYVHGNRNGPPGLITMRLPNSHYNLRQQSHQLQILVPEHSRHLTADIPLYRGFLAWNCLTNGDHGETTAILNGPYAAFQSAVSADSVFAAVSTLLPTLYPMFSNL